MKSDYLSTLDRILDTQKYEDCKHNNELHKRALISVFRNADRTPEFEVRFTSSSEKLERIFFALADERTDTEFEIRPQLSIERAHKIKDDLIKFKSECYIVENAPTGIEHSELLKEMVQKLQEKSLFAQETRQKFQAQRNCSEPGPTENSCLNAAQFEGISLIIYLIENHIAGTTISARKTVNKETGEQETNYVVKWGGYLTVAGLRQAFMSGRQTHRRFLKTGCEVSIKVFHGSERRIGNTAIGLLLGFLCEETVSIDQLLPILKEEPYTRSDFICPDVLLYLEQKYGQKKIYPLGMTVMELRNKLNVDDQGLSLNDTTKVKMQLEEQHADLSRYLMASSEGFQVSKKISAFKASFDPILARMKRKQNVVMTHLQALERVA